MRLFSSFFQALQRLLCGGRYGIGPDDDTFYRTYYGDTDIPKDIPIRVRRVCVEQLGRRWVWVGPDDRPIELYDDLDFAELMYEMAEEFGIAISLDEIRSFDGSFDGIVQYLATKHRTGTLPIK